MKNFHIQEFEIWQMNCLNLTSYEYEIFSSLLHEMIKNRSYMHDRGAIILLSPCTYILRIPITCYRVDCLLLAYSMKTVLEEVAVEVVVDLEVSDL